jgi:pimeloyl-ACP methyl ester carboxylesterase
VVVREVRGRSARPVQCGGDASADRFASANDRGDALDQPSARIRTQQQDIAGKTYHQRPPARPRPDKPIALFLPGLLAALPLTAVHALVFVDLFDIVLCELRGHGASGGWVRYRSKDLPEYAAVIDAALKRATTLFVIGEPLGGLVAPTLARLRPGQIRNVILIDTEFRLTMPGLAAWISERGGTPPDDPTSDASAWRSWALTRKTDR